MSGNSGNILSGSGCGIFVLFIAIACYNTNYAVLFLVAVFVIAILQACLS